MGALNRAGALNRGNRLLALVSNNLRTTGAILVSVIKRPKNKNFLITISDYTEFSSESFKSNCLGVNLGTKKRFLRNHCWHLSNFSIKVGVAVNSSTPYSKEYHALFGSNYFSFASMCFLCVFFIFSSSPFLFLPSTSKFLPKPPALHTFSRNPQATHTTTLPPIKFMIVPP